MERRGREGKGREGTVRKGGGERERRKTTGGGTEGRLTFSADNLPASVNSSLVLWIEAATAALLLSASAASASLTSTALLRSSLVPAYWLALTLSRIMAASALASSALDLCPATVSLDAARAAPTSRPEVRQAATNSDRSRLSAFQAVACV